MPSALGDSTICVAEVLNQRNWFKERHPSIMIQELFDGDHRSGDSGRKRLIRHPTQPPGLAPSAAACAVPA